MNTETLMSRVRQARMEKGLSQQQIAEAVGMSQPSYYKIENGLTQRSGYINDIAEVLGVDVGWLLNGVDAAAKDRKIKDRWSGSSSKIDTDDHVEIPIYNVFFCCGDGSKAFDFEEVKGYRKMPKNFFTKEHINPDNFKLVCAANDSMAPFINDKDEVGIDISDTEIRDGQVYALLLDGERMFKRVLREAGGALRLTSFNPSYPDKVITADNHESLMIVGRQVYRAG